MTRLVYASARLCGWCVDGRVCKGVDASAAALALIEPRTGPAYSSPHPSVRIPPLHIPVLSVSRRRISRFISLCRSSSAPAARRGRAAAAAPAAVRWRGPRRAVARGGGGAPASPAALARDGPRGRRREREVATYGARRCRSSCDYGGGPLWRGPMEGALHGGLLSVKMSEQRT